MSLQGKQKEMVMAKAQRETARGSKGIHWMWDLKHSTAHEEKERLQHNLQ